VLAVGDIRFPGGVRELRGRSAVTRPIDAPADRASVGEADQDLFGLVVLRQRHCAESEAEVLDDGRKRQAGRVATALMTVTECTLGSARTMSNGGVPSGCPTHRLTGPSWRLGPPHARLCASTTEPRRRRNVHNESSSRSSGPARIDHANLSGSSPLPTTRRSCSTMS
jgi:hypothetical protein